MKTNLISLIALSTLALALALAPAYGAPKERNCPYLGGHHQPTCPYLTGHAHGHGIGIGSHDVSAQRIPREQAGARNLVANLTTTQKSALLGLLNDGTAKDLALIRGISHTRAAAIANARPFQSIDEVILVKGIGKATMGEIVNHAWHVSTHKKS